MPDGELAALFLAIAKEAAESLESAGKTLARLNESTAAIEESNVRAIQSVDDQIAGMIEEMGLPSATGKKLGLLGKLKFRLTRVPEVSHEWTVESGTGLLLHNGEYGWDSDLYYDPPPDQAGQSPDFVNVYVFHDAAESEPFRPKLPPKRRTVEEFSLVRGPGANYNAVQHALGKDSSFVTVTLNMVDPADPPGQGRLDKQLLTTFRVPRVRLFNPRETNPWVKMPAAEGGERYYLGDDLEKYKVSERINPFWR